MGQAFESVVPREDPIFITFYKGHEGYISSVSWNASGSAFCSGGWDNSVRVWSTTSLEQIGCHKNHSNRILSVDHLLGHDLVASGSQDNTILLWDYAKKSENNPPIVLEDHKSWVWSVKFSKAGNFLLSTSKDKTVRLFDLNQGVPKCYRILNNECEVICGIFNTDPKEVITGGNDSVVRIWDLREKKCSLEIKSHTSIVYDVDCNKFLVASGSNDSNVYVHDIRKADLILRKFDEHKLSVYSVRFSPEGSYVLTGSKDNTIKAFEVVGRKKNEKKRMYSLGKHDGPVMSVDITIDGKWFLSGSGDGNIALWEKNEGFLEGLMQGGITGMNQEQFTNVPELELREELMKDDQQFADEFYIFMKGIGLAKYYKKMKEHNINIGYLEKFLRDPESLEDFIDLKLHRTEFIEAARDYIAKKEEESKDQIKGEFNWKGKSFKIQENHAFYENQRLDFEKLTSNVYKIKVLGDIFVFMWDNEDEMLRVVKAKGGYEFIKRITTTSTAPNTLFGDGDLILGEYDWNGRNFDIKKKHVFLGTQRYSFEKVASTVYTVEIDDNKYVFNWDKEDEVLGVVQVEGDEFFERIEKKVFVKKIESTKVEDHSFSGSIVSFF